MAYWILVEMIKSDRKSGKVIGDIKQKNEDECPERFKMFKPFN